MTSVSAISLKLCPDVTDTLKTCICFIAISLLIQTLKFDEFLLIQGSKFTHSFYANHILCYRCILKKMYEFFQAGTKSVLKNITMLSTFQKSLQAFVITG